MILASCLQDCSGAFDIRLVHLGRVTNPQPVIGGDMKHYIAASHCAIDRFRIAQVANDPIRIQLLNVLWVAASANQQSEGGSLLGKNLGDVTTHKSGGTCNKGLHKRGLLSNDPLTKLLRLERNVALSRRFLFP